MNNSKQSFVCNPDKVKEKGNYVCVFCDMPIDEEIDETNWIPVKRHCHDSQVWSVEEDYELLCNECKTFRCERCI